MSRVEIPQDIQAEKSLLATICAAGSEHEAALLVPGICPEDFMHPAHRAVFEALRCLVRNGEENSALTLKAHLEAAGKLGTVGGYSGLVEILSAEEVQRPEILVEILAKHRRRRELMRLGAKLQAQGQDTAEDPDEVLHGAIAEAHRITRDGRQGQGEGWEEILHAMSSFEPFSIPGQERGGWWGIPALDSIAPIPCGEFVTVGARPGVGKTALMTQIAIESARKGIKTLVVTLELPKLSMRARLASYLAGVSVSTLKRGEYAAKDTNLVGHQAEILAHGRLQAPPAKTPWPKLEAMMRYEVDRYGIQLILLDQFDKIGRPPVGKGSSEAYAFGEVSTGIMAMVKDLGIGFGLMCQLKGDAEGREPTLADHADSDRPAKDAGVVLHLWRNKIGDLKAKLQKNRDGAFTGKRFDLDFQGERQKFIEIEPEDSPYAVSAGRML